MTYDRDVLVNVLVYHYRKDHASCGCGWAELGRSHPEHVATVYEESAAMRLRHEWQAQAIAAGWKPPWHGPENAEPEVTP